MGKLNSLEKPIIALGILDITFILWVLYDQATNEINQFSQVWENLISFGLPFPMIQFSMILLFYVSIFVSGISLVIRNANLVWINYFQFPFRIVLVVPTLYPIFYLFSQLNIDIGVFSAFIIISFFEIGRVVFVFKWSKYEKCNS